MRLRASGAGLSDEVGGLPARFQHRLALRRGRFREITPSGMCAALPLSLITVIVVPMIVIILCRAFLRYLQYSCYSQERLT